ncbi:MAG: nucleotidyltransferase family protein [Campylobacterota bacterium]|nr:nucleotidyltransferase family protein [Campylobacterota bacterium]
MLNKQFILTFLKENKKQLKDKYQVDKIGLFGSFARDEETNKSDIDILVDMPSSFDNYFNLKYFLEENFHREVDLGKEKQLRLLIKKQVMQDIIYV